MNIFLCRGNYILGRVMFLKNIFFYKDKPENKGFEIEPCSKSNDLKKMGRVSKNIDDNINFAEELFSLDIKSDVVKREFDIPFENGSLRAMLLCVEGLSNMISINDFILEPLMSPKFISDSGSASEQIQKRFLPQTQLSTNEDIDLALQAVNIGNAVVFVDTVDICFSIDVKSWEHRGVSNPENEAVIQGPHEGFNEVLRCNTALIRKTLNTPNLILENITVGKTSKTPGAVAYLKNVANDSLVNEVKRRISLIDAEYILSTLDVEQYIEEDSFLPVPQMITTERPDRVCKALTEGRVAFILNGSSHALIMPATIFDLVTSAEDGYLRYPYSLLTRLLRYLAVFLALLFPAVVVSVLNYHPELLLTNILLAVSSSRALVPFGALVELVIMEIAFELIKEAGIRVPGPIGSTLGIVGGLIIGQAAVEANLVSPIMIIIVAVTGIASFTIPSYSLSFAFRFSRFLYILGGAVAGLYGVAVLFFINTLLGISTKSFGVPFISPLSPADDKNRINLIFGSPIWKRGTRREEYLKPKDMYKKAYISRKWRK